MKQVRRRSHRRWLVLLGIFVMVFLFTFLLRNFKKPEEEVEAASLANFDPGYIISDYTMGNYNAMTEAEIQAFLLAKGNCRDTRTYLADYYTGYSYHIKDGHFVCLAEETFGEGVAYGEAAPGGESAAHVIWQAAQDYRINPQVLIVLLQKEQGLITDSWPNSRQFKVATGYGCPDTAPCDAQYYGFKNQVRKAAALFRTVLDGGWTNYPLGENYIQYNPSAECGGSVVNIRSLATSALYRYTPYQPNAEALAAGYGTAPCGAYGNRNFYLYFEDWFGGIHSGGRLGEFDDMIIPRLLYVGAGARYVSPSNDAVEIRKYSSFEYFTHLNRFGDKLCLSIGNNRNCYIYSDLEEIEVGEPETMVKKRMLIVSKETNYLDFRRSILGDKISSGSKAVFNKKIVINGQVCLQTDEDKDEGRCVLYSNLQELPDFEIDKMVVSREIYIKKDAEVIGLDNGISEKIVGGEKVFFTGRASWFGELCLQRESDEGTKKCILYNNLKEIIKTDYFNMTVPRFMRVKAGSQIVDASIGENVKEIEDEEIIYFDKKMSVGEELCLQSKNRKIMSKSSCIKYDDLEEIANFSKMDVPRSIAIKDGAKYQDLSNKGQDEAITGSNNKMYFVDKIDINGGLCLRTEVDAERDVYRCIRYSDLEE